MSTDEIDGELNGEEPVETEENGTDSSEETTVEESNTEESNIEETSTETPSQMMNQKNKQRKRKSNPTQSILFARCAKTPSYALKYKYLLL